MGTRRRKAKPDDVSADELREAVEHMHECKARFVEAAEVRETHEGRTVWEGAVKVFALTGHPKAERAYARSYVTQGARRRLVAILGLPRMDGPIVAVKTAVLAQVREVERARN